MQSSFHRSRALVFSTSVAALSVAGLYAGCSTGGAPEGGGVERPDGALSDGGRSDGRVGNDLAHSPRSEVNFAAAATYAADVLAFHLAIGRFNSDAAPDILVGGQTQATVYLNRGDGTFETRPVLLGFGASWQVSADDVSGDGLGDLTLSDGADMRYAVALGKGDGSFNTPTYPVMRVAPGAVTAVSLNGDGAIDLVAGNTGDAQLHVLLNNGNGTFRDTGGYAAADSAMANPRWLIHGDWNRDGKQDVISANGLGSLTYLAGNGDGSLQKTATIASIPSPNMADSADLNGDGNLDLAVISDTTTTISILLGKGNGTFNPGQGLTLGAASGQGLQIGDVNGDGIVDIVAVCAGAGKARVFLGKGDGTFLPEKLFPGSGNSPFDIAIADFNNDGLNDLVLSEGTDRKISVLLNTTTR